MKMRKLETIGKSLSRKDLKSIIGGGYTGGWAGTKGTSCFVNMGCTDGTICSGPYFSNPTNGSQIGHCA